MSINPEIKNLDFDKCNITIFGKRGYGKTTLARYLISQIVLKKCVIILDVLNEYSGQYHFTSNEDFLKHITEYKLKSKKSYVLKLDNDEDYEFAFTYISGLHDILLVVEEADYFCNPHYINDGFKKIIKYGRHLNINYLAICRRPPEINSLILSQSNYIFTFRQSLIRDIEYLKKYGFDDDIADLEKLELRYNLL
jgi:DNA helicase HerA-like ATPase